MSFGIIDYDALAAAMLRAQSAQILTLGAGKTTTQGGLSESSEQGGLVLKAGADASLVDASAAGIGGDALERKVTTTSSTDWSALVESELKVAAAESPKSDPGRSQSDTSVTFATEKPSVSSKVANLQFGGMAKGVTVDTVTASSGYYSTVVRNARAVELRRRLESELGCKIPKIAHESLAIVTYAAGCMPDVVQEGKRRLRTLAAVGDAALTLQLSLHCWRIGSNVESAQAVRSRLTSNKSLIDTMVRRGYVDCVSYPSGVDPAITVATATAFEALLGVLTLYCYDGEVLRFLELCGLFQNNVVGARC